MFIINVKAWNQRPAKIPADIAAGEAARYGVLAMLDEESTDTGAFCADTPHEVNTGHKLLVGDLAPGETSDEIRAAAIDARIKEAEFAQRMTNRKR